MKIQANHSGTRTIEVTEKHLETIDKYSLLRNLIDSNGIIDETVVDKLRFNVRGILESEINKDNDLLDLCLDVIYNNNMKAFRLARALSCSISNGRASKKKSQKPTLKKRQSNHHGVSTHRFSSNHKEECQLRGWDRTDVILFSGDAYVDHPAFGAAVIGRMLESKRLSGCHSSTAGLAWRLSRF